MNLNQSHEGDDKFNQAKLKTFRIRLERLKMSEEERIAKYFLSVDEVTNMIKDIVK